MQQIPYTLLDLSFFDLALSAGLILIAIGLSRLQQLGLGRELLIGAFRTFLQLIAIGYVLKYIFALRQWYLILLAIFVMISVAAHTVSGRQRRPSRGLSLLVAFAMSVGSGFTVFLVTQIIIQIEPWYEPHYIIPLMGMIVGNSMNAATLAVERLDSEIAAKKTEVEVYLALGGTSRQAVASYMKSAMKAAMIPTINSMMVVGIVALPGMMTGQILSGTSPLVAVKYQILIMYMIAFSVAASSFILVNLRVQRYFTRDHQLREELLG